MNCATPYIPKRRYDDPSEKQIKKVRFILPDKNENKKPFSLTTFSSFTILIILVYTLCVRR